MTAPSGALWWGIFYCLAECAVVYSGFAWLSGCVNRALHTASDCVQRLIDGIPESDGAAAFFFPGGYCDGEAADPDLQAV